MTLGGNLSNLSGLMISVAHPPQVVARSQHMPLCIKAISPDSAIYY